MIWDKVPAWAHNWCYYFLAMAIFSATAGLYALVKERLSIPVVIAILSVAGMQFATAITLFWMCRRSLA